ncbi:MAG: hypothetical protein KKC54_08090 [Nanoarchaeota archaeon]|nr:hypothetical protein [Nanoarchaeota archaeon]MBU1946896.1 hypothetical protein [Nanoarchaeota archaeon]
MPYCRICGHKSQEKECKNCKYLLDNGADEQTIKRMLSNDEVNKIWKENGRYSEKLAHAYYDSIIENYPENKDSKENFGFNTFVDGIRLGLDIVVPLLDEKARDIVVAKIDNMIKRREERKQSSQEQNK